MSVFKATFDVYYLTFLGAFHGSLLPKEPLIEYSFPPFTIFSYRKGPLLLSLG